MDLIKSMSGKVCMHSDTYFRNIRGNCFTGKICNPRTKPFTEVELQNQAKFKAVHQAVNARAANPSTLAADRAAFQAQKSNGYQTFRGYLFHVAYENASYNSSTGTWSVSWPTA